MYEHFMYFFIYGFLGWVLEVFFHAVNQGIWTNRGFLNGAICPIYGIGVAVVVGVLEPISDAGPLLFVEAVVLCTLLELVTGFAMDKLFHQRWWDYSTEKWNLGGYICLKFSLAWGFACVFVVKLMHPTMERLVAWIPETAGSIILAFLGVALLVDTVDTVRTVMGINRELSAIQDGAHAIRKMSDDLSEQIFEGTMKAKNNKEELDLQVALGKAELERKSGELKDLARKYRRGQKRLFRAFPDMRSTRYQTGLESVRELIERHTGLKF